jgi:DNA-binding protein HU-beta
LNKADLVDSLVANVGLPKGQAEKVIDSLMETVITEVAKGGKVLLVGFGSWETSQRKERNGRNPKTNEPLRIPAKRVVRFKVGKEFAQAVNKSK